MKLRRRARLGNIRRMAQGVCLAIERFCRGDLFRMSRRDLRQAERLKKKWRARVLKQIRCDRLARRKRER